MYKELDGYHAYYAYPDYQNPYEHLNILVQLASALYWKKHFGKIHLVCNIAHLKNLQIYGVDKVYDSVDLDLLKDMDSFDIRYWSLAKIHLAGKLAETKNRFTILDTDLWLRGIPKQFDLSKDFIGLHRESFVVTDDNCAYPEPESFIGGEEALKYDWSTLPINTGVMYLNNPELVKEWYEFAKSVIERNRFSPHPKAKHAVETIFIEQRILPTLATDRGYKVGTLIPSTYHTNLDNLPNTETKDNWEPTFASSPEMEDCFEKIKHVWGLKKQFGDSKVRVGLSTLVIRNLEQDGFDLSEYGMLLQDNVI